METRQKCSHKTKTCTWAAKQITGHVQNKTNMRMSISKAEPNVICITSDTIHSRYIWSCYRCNEKRFNPNLMQYDLISIQLNTMRSDAMKKIIMLCNSVLHRDVLESKYHIRKGNPWHGAKTEAKQDMSAGIRAPCSNMKQGNKTRRWEYTQSSMFTRKQRHDGSVRDL